MEYVDAMRRRRVNSQGLALEVSANMYLRWPIRRFVREITLIPKANNA